MRAIVIITTVTLFFAGFFFHLYDVSLDGGGYDIIVRNRRHYESGLGINYRSGFAAHRLSQGMPGYDVPR